MGNDWKSTDPGPALRPYRGGTPSPDSTVYRDRDIDMLYEQVEAGESVVLTAEKRVGKTSLVKLLRERTSSELTIVYRDVENVNTPKRLVELLCRDLDPLLSTPEKAKHWLRERITALGGTGLGPITLPQFDERHWQAEFDAVFDAVARHLDEDGRALVLIWDEAPWMVEKVRLQCGWQTAVDLLDELRQLRNRHPAIRFVFTGSIGFHHVLRDLRDGLSHRQSINDMRQSELRPLDAVSAGKLAWRLLKDIQTRGATFAVEVPTLAEAAAGAGEGIPWFIHAIVDDLFAVTGPLDLASVDRVVHDATYAGNDSWHLRHYVERVESYYGAEAPTAGRVLDAVAVREWSTADDVVADLSHDGAVDRDAVLALLRLLQEDHYLERTAQGWRFQYRLIRETWMAMRDLEGAA